MINKIQELEKQYKLLGEEIEKLKLQSEPFKYPKGKTFMLDLGGIKYRCNGATKAVQEYGLYRLTEETAQQSLARNKRANRLEAKAEQLGGLIKFEADKENYCIYKGYFSKVGEDNNKWYIDCYSKIYCPETVYMTKECAEEICRQLNSGEFTI